MTPLAERMVEAAARAMSADQKHRHGQKDCPWEDDIEIWRTECRHRARAALTAALAVAEEAGVGLFVVPEPKGKDFHAPTDDWAFYPKGWNDCRAATLAGRVSFYDPLTLLTQEAQDMGMYNPTLSAKKTTEQ